MQTNAKPKQAKKAKYKSQSLKSPTELPLCDSLGIETGEQANRQGKGTRQAKNAKPKRRGSQKRKLESSIPSGVTTVAILVFGSSMHDGKARVHRSESGLLLASVSEKGNLTRKHRKKGKKKDKTN